MAYFATGSSRNLVLYRELGGDMSERDDLLVSIANAIATYRDGELPRPTAGHVDRWVNQFTSSNQIEFLREFSHVINQTFIEKATVIRFYDSLIENPKLTGSAPKEFWKAANILRIQKAGQSQKQLVSLLGERLHDRWGLKVEDCGRASGEFIYLDDVLFSGSRIATDLEDWIANQAPGKAVVQVVLLALHTGGYYYISSKRLKSAIAASGKDIKVNFWRIVEIQNQKYWKDSSEVLWPAYIPNDPDVQAYVASETRFPHELRRPGGKTDLFSSEQGRHILEQEFLIAGVKIRSMTQSPKSFVRPLGFSSFGVGFGSMIVTYRNCPNNCPLALWWGDPEAKSGALHWYPLLARKTYSSAENVFSEL